MLHLACGGAGFLCLVAACLLLARRFARERARGWAVGSALIGVVFLTAFAGIASGGASAPAVVIAFTVAVVAVWTWLSALHVHLYRGTRR
jgi:hypothetical protein